MIKRDKNTRIIVALVLPLEKRIVDDSYFSNYIAHDEDDEIRNF